MHPSRARGTKGLFVHFQRLIGLLGIFADTVTPPPSLSQPTDPPTDPPSGWSPPPLNDKSLKLHRHWFIWGARQKLVPILSPVTCVLRSGAHLWRRLTSLIDSVSLERRPAICAVDDDFLRCTSLNGLRNFTKSKKMKLRVPMAGDNTSNQ